MSATYEQVREAFTIPSPEQDQIMRAVTALHDDQAIIELRALYKRGKRVDAGCFDGEHRNQLVKEAARLNAAGAAVYVTMNEIDPQMLARYANRVQEHAQATATDSNVTRRRWLLIDVDPQRPKDTSATGEQIKLATERTHRVHQFLAERGWPAPVTAESGNGFHLLYRIDLPNDAASADLIKRCLEALSSKFDDDAIKIDRSVFNAGRIIKLHGTVANKGDHVAPAPWRLSKLRKIPDEIRAVPPDLLQALADEGPAKSNQRATDAVSRLPSAPRPWTEADVDAFLARDSIEATGPDLHDGALRWKLKTCPFNPDHGAGESAVFLRPDGRLGFECRHNSCQDRRWRDLRTLVDGERRSSADADRVHTATKIQQHGVDDWPAPTPLPQGLPPVAEFNYELLPATLRRRVEDIAERMQCPPDFPAIALMTMLASLLGRRCGIAPKRADNWTVVPNLWGIAIGRPGIMKSPPLTEIMKPLQALQVRAREQFEQGMADHQAGSIVAAEAQRVAKDQIRKMLKEGKTGDAQDRAEEAVRMDADEPTCRRYIVNDSTVEKLGEILNENPNGVLLFRDELNGFFRTLERQGHEADRAFYLECWNGDGSFTYDRIARGTLHIAGACLSILGSIQPGPLSDLVRGLRGSGDDGLLQRFQLAVWPDVRPGWCNIDRAPDRDAHEVVQRIIDRFDRMTAQTLGADPGDIPVLRFSAEAQALFDEWREELELRLRGDSEHPMLEAHLAKYRSLVPSIALLIHLTETDEGPVKLPALERAIAWADYLETHARRIYAPAISPDMDAARALAARITTGNLGERFGLRDIYRQGWSGLTTVESAAAAVRVLEDFDWLRSEQEQTPGRTRTVYRINPALMPERKP